MQAENANNIDIDGFMGLKSQVDESHDNARNFLD
jgi:hypothetical protein